MLPGAVPTIFPNLPKYLSKSVPKKRRTRTVSTTQPCLKRANVAEGETAVSLSDIPNANPLTSVYEDIPLPSCHWGKHIWTEAPLKVAYSVCHPGSDMGVLCAKKLVIFSEEKNQMKHQVFFNGVPLSFVMPDSPASLLQSLDALEACSGAGAVSEFFFASSSSKVKPRADRILNLSCK